MAIALLADIHGNLEALAACLADVRRLGIGRLAFLGDYVGYGADPAAVVRRIRAEIDRGALAIAGNHDRAVSDPAISMNGTARAAIEWTRTMLDSEARRFLDGLPLTIEEADRLYVHAEASVPAAWNYIIDADDTRRSLAATAQRITICGHVHEPMINSLSPSGRLTSFVPVTHVAVPLLSQRRWLIVLGSVGQPRDGNPAASYAALDEVRGDIAFQRVPYDIDTAAAKIRRANLPERLAARLYLGK